MNKLGFRKVFFTSAVAVAVLFSGCGSDDDKKKDDSGVTVGDLGGDSNNTDNSNTVGGVDDNGNQSSGLIIGESRAVEVLANAGGRYFVIDLNPNETDSTYKIVGGEDEYLYGTNNKIFGVYSGVLQFMVKTDEPKDADGDDVYNVIVSETIADNTVTNIEINVTVIP